MRYTDLSSIGAPSGLWLIEADSYADERGYFYESYRQDEFAKHIGSVDFVQDNHAYSKQGVARGLHYQMPPYAQGKLVRSVNGAVFDIALDIRKSSSSFGQWYGVELSSENKKQLWIPEGFAHGYVCLTESCDFVYKTTHFYAPEYEASINFNDSEINIVLPEKYQKNIQKFILSDKDSAAVLLKTAEIQGFLY